MVLLIYPAAHLLTFSNCDLTSVDMGQVLDTFYPVGYLKFSNFKNVKFESSRLYDVSFLERHFDDSEVPGDTPSEKEINYISKFDILFKDVHINKKYYEDSNFIEVYGKYYFSP